MSHPQINERLFSKPEEAFCHLAECTAATYERLKMTKRTSKREIDRHERILAMVLGNLLLWGVTPEQVDKYKCPRIAELLRAIKGNAEQKGEHRS